MNASQMAAVGPASPPVRALVVRDAEQVSTSSLAICTSSVGNWLPSSSSHILITFWVCFLFECFIYIFWILTPYQDTLFVNIFSHGAGYFFISSVVCLLGCAATF